MIWSSFLFLWRTVTASKTTSMLRETRRNLSCIISEYPTRCRLVEVAVATHICKISLGITHIISAPKLSSIALGAGFRIVRPVSREWRRRLDLTEIFGQVKSSPVGDQSNMGFLLNQSGRCYDMFYDTCDSPTLSSSPGSYNKKPAVEKLFYARLILH